MSLAYRAKGNVSNRFAEYLYLLFDDADHIPLDSESVFA